ncbi:MAG: DUF5107 domain-containing protein [Gemmatimonadales bacterium]|nr:MAG: DUF5107 domain-containing protein [Gemmatimonadales bacterium]
MATVALLLPWAPLGAQGGQGARISEAVRTLDTYPFSEPNPVPILTRDTRLYPYHSFEGYAADSRPEEWTVVTLENDWIEVYVLPEVGGKVWGAVVKETGHEFIYRNEVLKFRNIALRGPWTSGGIEFNFGVIGHTPATATPVDYILLENPDGSVSCVVGGMDLPSRTHWRVEIRLPPDRATFETRVLWYNPTPLEQPYYNWMTGAAFAREDLVLTLPGDAYLEHSGQVREWPAGPGGRDLSLYRNNTFGGHKSYHVVGEVADFFGGYYGEADYGFGHWAPYQEMPGQKLWLWALSREGGVWEDLLTDTDGQYVEFQAGRLLVQYSPGAAVNPITQAGFDPLSASRWSESWFPLEGLGGLTQASRDGALHLERGEGRTTVAAQAFRAVSDTLRVWVDGELAASEVVSLGPLEIHRTSVAARPGARIQAELPGLDLDYDTEPAARRLSRPFATDPAAWESVPEVDRIVFQARERMKGREYPAAREGFEAALAAEPWNRDALLGAAELDYRSGLTETALARVRRALQLDAYDAETNFLAGVLYRDLDRTADAHDAFGWAARSTGFRSGAYAQLAEMALAAGDAATAADYARRSLDFDRYGTPGWRVVALAARMAGDDEAAEGARAELLALDPLHHFAWAEAWLEAPGSATARAFLDGIGGEYPDQTLLELAVGYVGLGQEEDALRILELVPDGPSAPVATAWRAYLTNEPSELGLPAPPAFAFPYRRESLPVLAWAAEHHDDWSWRYLLALNLWAVDRPDEALEILDGLGTGPGFAPLHAARAHLARQLRGTDPVPGLQRAVELEPETRTFHVLLARALLDQDRGAEALAVAEGARARFPGDFNLALLQVRALLLAGRGDAAAQVLDGIRVLPSENARESHALYAQAHLMTALDRLEAGDPGEARAGILRALEWPERLGQGRPYEPEERLAHFLLAQVEGALGNAGAARAHYQQVAAATGWRPAEGSPGVLDLLGHVARRELDEAVSLDPAAQAPASLFRGVEGELVERVLRRAGVR